MVKHTSDRSWAKVSGQFHYRLTTGQFDHSLTTGQFDRRLTTGQKGLAEPIPLQAVTGCMLGIFMFPEPTER
ncbi:hypothetical protein ACOMHN_010293 [Nucella lapillus]